MRFLTIKWLVAFIPLCIALSYGISFAQENVQQDPRAGRSFRQIPDSTRIPEQASSGLTTGRDLSTGYFMQPESEITGAVGSAHFEKIPILPSGNVNGQFQGRFAGVSVIGNGQPGSVPRIRIRGFSSFLNNEPFYIVDGVPTQDISSLNPNDIEQVTLLKDAGANALYGSRASSGVMVIMTKKGDTGVRVTYGMYSGVQSPGKGPDNLLSSEEHAQLQWLVYQNDGTVELHPLYGESRNPEPTLPPWAANTNWYDLITRRAKVQNHDLSLSGGNDNSRYYTAFGYFNQDGIILHTFYERLNARFNSEWEMMDGRLKIGEYLYLSKRSGLSVPNLSEESPVQMGPYRSQSIIPVIISDEIRGMSHQFLPGEFGGTGIAPRLGNARNVYADLTRAKDNRINEMNVTGSLYAEIRLLRNLLVKSTLGGNHESGHQYVYRHLTYENSENLQKSSLTENSWYGSDWSWTNLITFEQAVANHRIKAFAGYEVARYGMGRSLSGSASGYFSDNEDFRILSNGEKATGATSFANTPVRLVSTFLNIDYALKERYLLGVTVRRDGCSLFGPDHRFGIFPAVTMGWRISEEPFMKTFTGLTDLKIRGSWGMTGNQFALSPMMQFYQFRGSMSSSSYDLFGTFNSAVLGLYPVYTGNPDVKWEENSMLNFGLDASGRKGIWALTIDWYRKTSRDLLFQPEMPATAGTTEFTWINTAAVRNSGFEVELTYNNRFGDFGLEGNLVFSSYRNKITGISQGSNWFEAGTSRIGSFSRNEEGHPLGSFYGYKVEGLFLDQDEVDAAPSQDGAAPGFFRYANLDDSGNSAGRIDLWDQTFIGNPNPDFTYRLNLGVSWRNFDLSGFLYGSQGNDIFNYNKWWIDFWPSFQGQKSKELLYKSWTPDNTGAKVPMASNRSNFSTNYTVSDYFIEDGSFLRLKSLQFGYSLPGKLTGKMGITSFRVYLQGVNLFTFTGYSGLDPEIGGPDTSFGVDLGNYPNARQYLVGMNLGL